MIDVHELRIGNWLTDNRNGKHFNIGSIKSNFYDVSVNEMYLGFIDPIPLTHEILEKCGFEKHGRWNYLVIYEESIDNTFIEFDCDLNEVSLFLNNESLTMKHIKHVHQLQNLIFALTGEELNIEL